MYILAIYIILYIYRGVAGTKKCVGGGGGQTPKIMQAPVSLAFLMTRSYHYLQKSGGEYSPPSQKVVAGSCPPCPPFSYLSDIYLSTGKLEQFRLPTSQSS